MPVLAKLSDLKVNFLIVFVGAPLIILAIKAAGLLLPPKYYFSFSKLVAGSSEPFIVDPPGITAKKLCEVLAREAIPRSAFYGRIRTCDRDYERPFTREERDRIYDVAIRSDAEIRTAYREAEASDPPQPLSDERVREIAAGKSSVADAIQAVTDYYLNEIGRMFNAYDADRIAALYEPPDALDTMPDEDDNRRKLSDDVVAQIVRAHTTVRNDLAGINFAQRIQPIKKSALDEILSHQDGSKNVGPRISLYYTDQVDDFVRSTITNGFARYNLTINRKVVFEEINKFSWANYLLSALVRLTPVFLFGLLCGMLFGRAEIFSASLAGGLAAFLLSWPLILMWDRLVQGSWTDKKWLFFSFYAAYVVSFFLTARCAAVIGARLREHLPAIRGKIADGGVTWRDIAINTAGALAINAVVYAWNVYLPLSSANAQ
jgi:hypothetical protein